MSQKPPTPTDLNLPEKDEIRRALKEGRAAAAEAENMPLMVVVILQAYFHTVAKLALKSANPEQSLEGLLDIHASSARIELKELRETGL